MWRKLAEVWIRLSFSAPDDSEGRATLDKSEEPVQKNLSLSMPGHRNVRERWFSPLEEGDSLT